MPLAQVRVHVLRTIQMARLMRERGESSED
jgi:hypothetical protein